MMSAYEMLTELLEQGQFELILPEARSNSDGKTYREWETLKVVYLMNDAAESFLVFHNVKMTGVYDPDYEGELAYSLDCRSDSQVLVLYQGETVLTLFFGSLTLEVSLYDYGEIGHFWVKGYEYLRQLEYKIAIVNDKLQYLGAQYCTEEERRIASLAAFPPLNYCCYPAVSPKYVVEQSDAWTVSEEAIRYMCECAEQAKDERMLRALSAYRRCPDRLHARWIGMLLHHRAHAKTVDLLADRIRQEASVYPERRFDAEIEQKRQQLMKQALQRREACRKQGTDAVILREEPFVQAQDSISLRIYLMCWKYGWINRYTVVEEITEAQITEA